MVYDLYLGSLRVGTVTVQDKDFPNLWGRVKYAESLSRPSTAPTLRLANFIQCSCASLRLIDIEHEQDVSKELGVLNKELEQYQDLVDSDEWMLIDEKGSKQLILCPVFRDGGEIVWRWNPRSWKHRVDFSEITSQ